MRSTARKATSTPPTSFWIGALSGKNVARCFGFRDVPFLAEIHIYGRRVLIFPHPSGTNRWWNERRNERRARQLLQRFLRGETTQARFRKSGRSLTGT